MAVAVYYLVINWLITVIVVSQNEGGRVDTYVYLSVSIRLFARFDSVSQVNSASYP